MRNMIHQRLIGLTSVRQLIINNLNIFYLNLPWPYPKFTSITNPSYLGLLLLAHSPNSWTQPPSFSSFPNLIGINFDDFGCSHCLALFFNNIYPMMNFTNIPISNLNYNIHCDFLSLYMHNITTSML